MNATLIQVGEEPKIYWVLHVFNEKGQKEITIERGFMFNTKEAALMDAFEWAKRLGITITN